MRTVFWFVSTVLFGAVAVSPAHRSIAQTPLSPSPLPPLSFHHTPSDPTWHRLLQDYANSTPRDQGPGSNGGSRPADLCFVTPSREAIVWHPMPLFVWQGRIGAIGVRKSGSETLLWKQTAPLTDGNRLRYAGPPLQADQSYEWVVFSRLEPDADTPMLWIPFRLMPAVDRARVSTDLTHLETRLRRNRATSETIVLYRANYFAQRQLWSDALQTVFSTPTSSGELRRVTQQLIQEACRSSPTKRHQQNTTNRT